MPKPILMMIATLACSLVLPADRVHAQVNNSVYSMFGVGGMLDNSFGINKSLGGTGIAFQSEVSMNYVNPASYIGIMPYSFNLELGAYDIFNTSETANASQSDADFNFSYFSASWYLSKRWVLCLGLAPYSSVDYEIDSMDEIEGEPVSFAKKYTGSGGLSRVYLGNSFRIVKGLVVGFNASFILGVIKETEIAVRDANFTGYEFNNKRSVTGGYLDFGTQYSWDINDYRYTAGFVYGGGRTLNTTDEREFVYNGTMTTLEDDNDSDVEIPQKFGVGISMKKGSQFRIGVDYERKNWSDIRFTNPNLQIRNSERISTGLEYAVIQRENWLKNIYFRLGANYNKTYLQIDKVPINSSAVTLGVGIPFADASFLNLAVEYGKEGTLRKGLVKNSYWVYYLSFSLHEFWMRTKRY